MSEGVAVMERATEMASQMSLFSDNEDLVEVATSSLKWVKLSVVYHKCSLLPSLCRYLLLPALLGELTLQQSSGERLDTIRRARASGRVQSAV